MPTTPQLKFRDDFWVGLAWSRSAANPRAARCAKCFGRLPEVPLMLFRSDGAMIQLCESCIERWVIITE